MYLAFAAMGALLVLFLAIPLLRTVLSTTPAALWRTLVDAEVRHSILLTFYCGLLATAVGLMLGVPLAYMLARRTFPAKGIVEGLVDVPVVVPHTAAGIALLFVFGRRFLIGRFFHALGLNFVDEIAGIVTGMMFVSVPFLVNSAKDGFRSVDVRLENVARTLGASPWQTFLRVSLPLSWRSILSGSAMMWGRGISEFGAVIILTYHPMTTPVLVYSRFEAYGLKEAVPVTVVLVVVCLIVFAVLRAVSRREPVR
jgi:molybdate/tungstate transport system permease protein